MIYWKGLFPVTNKIIWNKKEKRIMEIKNPRKPILYYIITVLIIVLLLNTFVFPSLLKRHITQVDYGTFLRELEQGRVSRVEVQDRQIAFIIRDERGKENIYITGRMDDPDLVNRLYKANVNFQKVIPKEASPLLDFILYWILPMFIFIGLGQFFVKRMQGKMGGIGNAMSFGKSNARIYVEAETGKTFADVAGQEEAKEALAEVVGFLNQPEKYKKIGAKVPKESSW